MEREIRQREEEEYKRRERPEGGVKAQGLIPEPIKSPKEKIAEGVVVTTDSESETETARFRAGRELGQFKWSEELEDKLEDLLMENCFDFHKTAKDFSRFLNDGSDKWYQVDGKMLQLRWTDVEIRKYRMPRREDSDVNNEGQMEEDDDPLPPLEQVVKEEEAPAGVIPQMSKDGG